MLVLFVPVQAAAQSAGATDSGDWFDAELWDSGTVPSVHDSATIGDGFEVEAAIDSLLRPPGTLNLRIRELSLGEVPFSAEAASNDGALEVRDLDLTVERQLTVGRSLNGIGGSARLAVDGSLYLGGTASIGSSNVFSGFPSSTGPPAAGEGTLYVAGDVIAGLPEDAVPDSGSGVSLRIGEANDADAHGIVEIGGDLLAGTRSLTVSVGTNGLYRLFPSDPVVTGLESSGTLRIGGRAEVTSVFLAENFRSGTTEGNLEISGDLVVKQGVVLAPLRRPFFDEAPDTRTGVAQLSVDGDLFSGTVDVATGDAGFDTTRPGGSATATATILGDLKGTDLTDVNGDLRTPRLRVGLAFNLYEGAVDGTLEAESVSGFHSVTVGRAGGSGSSRTEPAGSVRGRLLVRSGGMTARPRDDQEPGSTFLKIGTSTLTGANVAGEVDVTGDIQGFEQVDLGLGRASKGRLLLRDGHLDGESLVAGSLQTDQPDASARLDLIGSTVSMSDEILLRGDSEISIRMDLAQETRGIGILTAPAIELGGLLELVFDGEPSEKAFDLVLATGPDGIDGDFDRIEVVGIDRSLLRFEFLPYSGEMPGANDRGLFRVSIIPEPSTALLLGIGLLGLASPKRP